MAQRYPLSFEELLRVTKNSNNMGGAEGGGACCCAGRGRGQNKRESETLREPGSSEEGMCKPQGVTHLQDMFGKMLGASVAYTMHQVIVSR